MSYTKVTNFAVKDGLPTGNPSKIVKGTEIDVEFNAIQTESAAVTTALAGKQPLNATLTNITAELAAKQAVDATLTSISALGTAADKVAYTTGVDTWAETSLTAAARTVLDDATVGAMLTTLGAAASGANTDITSMSAVAQISTATGVAVHGTNTNDSAAAGYVGEYIESIVLIGSAVSLTSTVASDITSVSLTAGDWDVSGAVAFNPAATTSITISQCDLSSTTGTLSTNVAQRARYSSAAQVPAADYVVAHIPKRFSLASTTTIYLVASANFTVSTLAAYGTISARRIR